MTNVHYKTGPSAAAEAGALYWKHLKRLDESSQRLFGAIGVCGSIVTAGVNLTMGARNMKRDEAEDPLITITLNNYTPHTFVISRFFRTQNPSLKTCVIQSDDSVTFELGSYNPVNSDDWGPGFNFVLDNGEVGIEGSVKLMNRWEGDHAGQIKVRDVWVDSYYAQDPIEEEENEIMSTQFFHFKSDDNHPEFLMVCGPVINAKSNLTLTFLD